MKRRLSSTLMIGFVLSIHPARAALCPAPEGASPGLASIDVDTRLAFLQSGMRHAAQQSRIWAWSTVAALLAVETLQVLGAASAPDRGDRIDLWVGSGALLFSLGQMAFVPPLVTLDQWTVDKHVERATPNNDRCALLAEAERFLVRDALSETRATGNVMHAVTLLFNIGVGLLLGVGFNRWGSAAFNTFFGAAVGELQIVTQPTESIDLLARYQSGNLKSEKEEKSALRWRLAPSLSRDAWGVAATLAF